MTNVPTITKGTQLLCWLTKATLALSLIVFSGFLTETKAANNQVTETEFLIRQQAKSNGAISYKQIVEKLNYSFFLRTHQKQNGLSRLLQFSELIKLQYHIAQERGSDQTSFTTLPIIYSAEKSEEHITLTAKG